MRTSAPSSDRATRPSQPVDASEHDAVENSAAIPGQPSVLWPRGDPGTGAAGASGYARQDLALDAIIDALALNRTDDEDLAGWLLTYPRDEETVACRQAVFRDLDDARTLEATKDFAGRMRQLRRELRQSSQSPFARQGQLWALKAAGTYCSTVIELRGSLDALGIASEGLQQMRDHVDLLAESPGFADLRSGAAALSGRIESLRYALLMDGARLTVAPYDDEPDYTIETAGLFERFKDDGVESHLHQLRLPQEVSHLEAGVVDLVAQVHPGVFEDLARFVSTLTTMVDPVVDRFDRELQFYLAFLAHTAPMRAAGLPLSLPAFSPSGAGVVIEGMFDLALAHNLLRQDTVPVCNDVRLSPEERLVVVTGPNQGGKTTFARAFGQVQHFARLGCPVPARSAQVPFCDMVYTHFEREEHMENLAGKLAEELQRLADTVAHATADSVVVMNEMFTLTTVHDALFLARRILALLAEHRVLCLFVTFLDELASLTDTTVSLVASVCEDDSEVRTFEIQRRPADGKAYAGFLARAHGLDRATLRQRMAS